VVLDFVPGTKNAIHVMRTITSTLTSVVTYTVAVCNFIMLLMMNVLVSSFPSEYAVTYLDFSLFYQLLSSRNFQTMVPRKNEK
jgi:hypothetical protein